MRSRQTGELVGCCQLKLNKNKVMQAKEENQQIKNMSHFNGYSERR